MKNRICFFLSALIFSSGLLNAAVNTPPKTQKTEPFCLPCEYTSACCPPLESSWGTISIRGEFLYWQPVITGMAYALTHTGITLPFNPFGPTAPLPDNVSIQNVKFGYSPGFRLGTRYTLPKTQWDLDFDYTQFTQTASDSVNAGNGTLVDTLWDAVSAINPSQANAEFEVKLKAINSTIAKTIPFAHCFTVRSRFGAQFYELNCIENMEYIGITTVDSVAYSSFANVQLANNTKGWGLLVGFDAVWRLPYYLEIYGEADYGVLGTKFTFSQNEQISVTSFNGATLTSKSNFSGIIQSIQVKGGINWNYPFNCRNHPLAIKLYAGYEMDVWLQDVQVTRVLSLGTSYSDAVTTNIGNVSFRGLTTGAAFSF